MQLEILFDGAQINLFAQPQEQPKPQSQLMQQHASIKAKYPDAILLFRVGDFYETFDDDAVKAANTLGIILTRNQAGAAMAGFPAHSLDTYLQKLVKAGYRVAICDQLEQPQAGKVTKRGVTDYHTNRK